MFWADAFISFFQHTNNNSYLAKNSIAMFSPKPFTLAGFEPGSSATEAAVMSTTPRLEGSFLLI
jgi:hypothetical protein